MILYSKLKNGLCKIVTTSQFVIKCNVTKSRLHCSFVIDKKLATLFWHLFNVKDTGFSDLIPS